MHLAARHHAAKRRASDRRRFLLRCNIYAAPTARKHAQEDYSLMRSSSHFSSHLIE